MCGSVPLETLDLQKPFYAKKSSALSDQVQVLWDKFAGGWDQTNQDIARIAVSLIIQFNFSPQGKYLRKKSIFRHKGVFKKNLGPIQSDP